VILLVLFIVVLIALGVLLVALGATKPATEKNRFEAKWESGRVAAQNELIEKQVSQDQMLISDGLVKKAARQGRTLETDQRLELEEGLSSIRVSEFTDTLAIKTVETARLEEALTQIRLTEFKEKDAIQFNNELKKMNEQVRLALIAKALSSHQRVMLVQELLDGLYKQIDEVGDSKLSPATKTRMIEDREAIISHFKGYRDAEGSRLLQAD
jgi:hypothetical protein